MKQRVFFLFFLISIVSFTANAAGDFLGSWNTTFGIMKLESAGENQLKGAYI